MKLVREWLKVNCTGKIKEVTNMEGFGKKGFDYFDSVKPNSVADLVVRVKKGGSIKARILRDGESGASLFVNWPGQLDKPSIIALQIYNGLAALESPRAAAPGSAGTRRHAGPSCGAGLPGSGGSHWAPCTCSSAITGCACCSRRTTTGTRRCRSGTT